MKKLILIVLLTLVAAVGFSQWTWRHPMPQGNDLASIWFLNPDSGFLLGRSGTIMKTTDGGTNWAIVNILDNPGPNPAYFKDVHFPDPIHGYAIDIYNGNIYKTSDGGQSWNCASILIDFLNSIYFTDSLHGFVVGDWGNAFRTSDGGITWSDMLPGNTAWFESVFFSGMQTGYIAGHNGLILHTTDGGVSWSQQSSGTNQNLDDITFTDPQSGFVVGNGGVVLRTTDAGNTWILHQSLTGLNYHSVSAFNHDTLMILGTDYDSSYVSRSTDGGNSWTRLTVSGHYPYFLNRLFCSDDGVAYVIGTGGTIVKTPDYGDSWTYLSHSLTMHPIACIDFPSAETGYAVAPYMTSDYSSTILKTLDGGQNWFALDTVFNMEALYTVCFMTDVWGVVAGDQGIYSTFDGGSSWTCRYILPGSNGAIKSVGFHGVTTGIAVGRFGLIMRTTDIGQSWVPVQSGTTSNLESVCFVSADTVFAAGDKVVLKSTDGGVTWLSLPTALSFVKICFVNSACGYGVGGKVIFKTVDGGVTWDVISPLLTSFTFDVKFIDADTGFVSGGYDQLASLLLKTTDGGITWQEIPIPSIYTLKSLEITIDNKVIIGGGHGFIFSADNGGCITSVESVHPTRFGKLESFPNPFSQSAIIRYEVSNPGPVCLTLTNSQGTVIRTIFSEEKRKGKYELELSGDGLTNGIYFLHLNSKETAMTRKIVIVR